MDFKKLHREAKKIRAKHPSMQYKTALRDAAKKMSGGISRTKKKPAKRKTGKRMAGVTTEGHGSVLAHARRSLKEQLGWAMATQATAKTKREKKALAPKIAALKKQLKALS